MTISENDSAFVDVPNISKCQISDQSCPIYLISFLLNITLLYSEAVITCNE